MILETSEVLRALSSQYNIPQISYFSSIHTAHKTINTHGVKKHFGFLHHKESTPIFEQDILQAIIPDKPYGHEIHIFRQDSDYFLLQEAIKRGVEVHQKTIIESVDFTQSQVEIKSKDTTWHAKFVVDGGSFRSLIRTQFELEKKICAHELERYLLMA